MAGKSKRVIRKKSARDDVEEVGQTAKRTSEDATPAATATAAASATSATYVASATEVVQNEELSENERAAAEQQMEESARQPSAGRDGVESPTIGTATPGSAGPASSEPPDPHTTGRDVFERMQTDADAGSNSEADEAVSTLEQMEAGERPSVGGFENRLSDLIRPGQSGDNPRETGFASPSVADGWEGGKATMNEYFTDKAMDLAAEGDSDGLDKLGSRMREHYGKPDPAPPEDEDDGTVAGAAYDAAKNSDTAKAAGKLFTGPGKAMDEVLAEQDKLDKKKQEEAKKKEEEEEAKKKADAEAKAKAEEEARKKKEEEAAAADPKTDGGDPGPFGDDMTPEERMKLAEYLRAQTGYQGGYRGGGEVDPNEHDDGRGSGDGNYVSPRDRLTGDGEEFTGGAAGGDTGESALDAIPGSQDDAVNYGPDGGGNQQSGRLQEVPTNVGPEKNLAHLNPLGGSDSSDTSRLDSRGGDSSRTSSDDDDDRDEDA